MSDGNLWLGSLGWNVGGDGISEPYCVYTLDASGGPVGFYPFGFSLPGMLEGQATALRDVLNAMRLHSETHEHNWQPLGFIRVPYENSITPADQCRCGAKRYAESSGHFGEPWPT